jgi:hypothetical protein
MMSQVECGGVIGEIIFELLKGSEFIWSKVLKKVRVEMIGEKEKM